MKWILHKDEIREALVFEARKLGLTLDEAAAVLIGAFYTYDIVDVSLSTGQFFVLREVGDMIDSIAEQVHFSVLARLHTNDSGAYITVATSSYPFEIPILYSNENITHEQLSKRIRAALEALRVLYSTAEEAHNEFNRKMESAYPHLMRAFFEYISPHIRSEGDAQVGKELETLMNKEEAK